MTSFNISPGMILVIVISLLATVVGIIYLISSKKKTNTTSKYDDILFKDLEDIKMDTKKLNELEQTKQKLEENKSENKKKTQELMKRASTALAGLDDLESLKKKFAPGTQARKDWIAKRKAQGKWKGPDE